MAPRTDEEDRLPFHLAPMLTGIQWPPWTRRPRSA
jgi:hypothetical protein